MHSASPILSDAEIGTIAARIDRPIVLVGLMVMVVVSLVRGIVAFMQSSPVVAVAVEGENVISRVRELLGPTDSRVAEKGTSAQRALMRRFAPTED